MIGIDGCLCSHLLGELPPSDQPVATSRLVDVLRLGDRPTVGVGDLPASRGVDGSGEVPTSDAELLLDHLTIDEDGVGGHEEASKTTVASTSSVGGVDDAARSSIVIVNLK